MSEVAASNLTEADLIERCKQLSVPVRWYAPYIINARGLCRLMDWTPAQLDQRRARGTAPPHREGAPGWRGCHYTYCLIALAAWMNENT